LSTALISKLETDRMVPTLQTLEKLCRAFGIDLGHFFCQPQTYALSITRKAHSHPYNREPPTPKSTPLHLSNAAHAQLSQILELPFGNSFTFGRCGGITELTAHVLERHSPSALLATAKLRKQEIASSIAPTSYPLERRRKAALLDPRSVRAPIAKDAILNFYQETYVRSHVLRVNLYRAA